MVGLLNRGKDPEQKAPSVAEALSELQRLWQAEIELSRRWLATYDSRPAALAEQAGGALDAMLAGDDVPAPDADQSAERTRQLDAMIAEARSRRVAAIPVLWAARAAQERREAADALKAADKLDQKIMPHLEALERITGAKYAPAHPATNTGAVSNFSATTRLDMFRSRAEQARNRAVELDAKRPERNIQRTGTLSGNGREQLAAGFEALSPERLAPTLPTLITWHTAAVAEVLERRKRVQFGMVGHFPADAPVLFSVTWSERHGEPVIDTARSTASNPPVQLPPNPNDAFLGIRVYDPRSKSDTEVARQLAGVGDPAPLRPARGERGDGVKIGD